MWTYMYANPKIWLMFYLENGYSILFYFKGPDLSRSRDASPSRLRVSCFTLGDERKGRTIATAQLDWNEKIIISCSLKEESYEYLANGVLNVRWFVVAIR